MADNIPSYRLMSSCRDEAQQTKTRFFCTIKRSEEGDENRKNLNGIMWNIIHNEKFSVRQFELELIARTQRWVV